MISTTQLLDIIKSDENLTLEQLLLQVPEIDFVTYLETLLLKKMFLKAN
ncbi:hypothetical protein SD457_04575 [Coprobacillaceae bacterium CR2/5/TPMF4]|nr:hypothetical protein SD457_04575 [Coprobacillaceae bacterium CR2/5/TPMF4]